MPPLPNRPQKGECKNCTMSYGVCREGQSVGMKPCCKNCDHVDR